MTTLQVIREGTEKKSKHSFSIVIRSADDFAPSTIQIIKESNIELPTPLFAPGISSLLHKHKTEQSKELKHAYDVLREELNLVVDSVDNVIDGVQTTMLEDVLQEAQERTLKLSGSFTGDFSGDGRKLKNIRWENIVGKRVRPGGGVTVLDPVKSASFAETASFALSFGLGGRGTGALLPLGEVTLKSQRGINLLSGTFEDPEGVEVDELVLSGSQTILIASDKVSEVTFLDTQPAVLILKKQGASLEEPQPESRKMVDFEDVHQVRIAVQVDKAGFASASVAYQFSSDSGSSWDFLNGADGPSVSIAQTGSFVSDYVLLTASATSSILIRWVAVGGNGTESPRISTLVLGRK